MKTERDDDKELLDLLGEAARADGGDAPGGERVEYAALLNEVRAADDATPSAAFNDRLRGAWVSEVGTSQPARPTRSRNWWRLSIPLAAAAAIAFVLLWPGGVVNDRSGSGVVWADVVKAMDRVGQFHLTAFIDDPRSADEKRKLFRYDMFYRQPDRLRIHDRGNYSVGFLINDRSYLWDKERGDWTANGDSTQPNMMFPRNFVGAIEKHGLVNAILSSFFDDGKVPAGEPVKSDVVAAAQGIDVFDYANKATERWMRIWVLRESKLPLKMHVYYPGSDEFVLVNFDYSDPQSEAFFSPEAFAEQARKVQSDDPQRLYSIGSTPVAGTRPRAADQIHAVEGGYKAPKVKRLASNEAGDVLLVTTRVENLTPTGHRPHSAKYQRITDTWGNEYLVAWETWGNSERGEHRWVLMAHPPMKRGDGARQITMTYVVEPRYGERTELAKETLDVPQPATQPAREWPKDLASRKHSAWREYLRHYGTLAQQLNEIEGSLVNDTSDMRSLSWKFALLREHGREDAAWALFEQHMRDRIFRDPKVLNVEYVAASQYLLYLASQQRDEELQRLSDSVKKMIETARASKDERVKSEFWQLIATEHSPLPAAANVMQWREQFKAGPQVVRTLAGRDGLMFIEIAIPKPPEGWSSNGWDGQAPYGWFWQPTLGEGWQINARLPKVEEGRLWLVVRGDGKQVPLSGEAMLALDNYLSKPTRHDVKVQWSRTIDVPQSTIDDMKAWWFAANGNSDQGWWPLPPPSTQPAAPVAAGPQDWMREADKLRDGGKYEAALVLYAKAIAAHREEWSPTYTQGIGLLDTVGTCKRQMRVSQARCLAELGRLDESRKVAAELRAMLPEKPDLADPLQGHVAADALAAELCIPRATLKQGDVKSAAAELEQLATRRPKLTDLPDGTMMVDRGAMKIGWHPRSKQKDAWRQYDGLWWEVKDALGSSATRPTTSAAAG